MRKKTSRVIVMVLALSIALSAFAFAAEPRASSYISDTYASISASGGGDISIDFKVIGKSTMTKLGASFIYLYDSDGTLVKNFYYVNSEYSNMMGSNVLEYSSSVSYSGTSGESYYAVVYFYAQNSNGSDSVTYTTDTVKA